MNNNNLFFTGLFTLTLLLFFDTIAKMNSFYYYNPNADIIMHLIGGFAITSLSMSVLRYMKMFTKVNIFIVILFMSVFWEYVEFRLSSNILVNSSFWIDTFIDLLMNCIGGIIAYICFYKIEMKQKNLQK